MTTLSTERTIDMNAIVFASDLSKAQEIAEKFTDGPAGEGMMYSKGTKEYTLRTFVRTPSAFASLMNNNCIVDILILYVTSAEGEDFSEARKYLDSRKSIPIKVLCSENPLIEEAAALNCKYVHVSELLGEGREAVIKEAKKFEETLINCFKKFDINGNGLISVDELVKVSSELGHPLEMDDAKMIISSLDTYQNYKYTGSIDFENFKKWWVMGKADFHSFRRICKAEMSINNLVKLTSKKFNNYLEKLKTDSHKASQEEILQSIDLNVHAKQEFENGLGLFLETCSGPKAKEVIGALPEGQRNSPFAVSLKFPFREDKDAKAACELLKQMVGPLLGDHPVLKHYLDLGIEYEFRTSVNYLVVDLWLSGYIADMVFGQASQFTNLQNVDINMHLTFHLFSSLVLGEIIGEENNFIQLVEKFLHLKFHLNVKSFGLRQLWGQLNEQLKSSFGEVPSFKKIMMLVDGLVVMRSFKLDFGFDAVDAKNTVFEVQANEMMNRFNGNIEETKAQIIQGNTDPDEGIKEFRAKFNEFKEQAEGFKAMVPPEILQILEPLKLDKFEVETYVNLPATTALVKVTVNLPGLNFLKSSLLY